MVQSFLRSSGRVSRVLAYQTSPRAKLESDRGDGAGLLDNGTPERP